MTTAPGRARGRATVRESGRVGETDDVQASERTLPKVLLVGPFPPTVGGVTTFLSNLTTSALRHQYSFLPFSISRPPKRETIDNDRYSALLTGGKGRFVRALMVTLWNALRFPVVLLRQGPDIVQLHSSDYWSFWESSYYLLVARLLRRSTVMRFGGCFDAFYRETRRPLRALIRWILNRPDVIVVQSESWQRFFTSLVPGRDIRILPNAIDADGFALERSSSAGQVRAVFLCGSEARRKGLDTVLSALQRLQGRLPELHVDFLAAGDAIRRRVDSIRLEGRITLHGVCDREQLARHLAHADFVLLPSFREGFPNSLLEAMAAGLPVITTPVGAIPEVVHDGEGALFVPAGDTDSLATAIETMTLDAEMRERFGDANHRRAREEYSRDRVFSRLADAYASLIVGEPKESPVRSVPPGPRSRAARTLGGRQ
ncbi:MAG: glycosyltransferase family 4 protein [Planctomycetota bacterium]